MQSNNLIKYNDQLTVAEAPANGLPVLQIETLEGFNAMLNTAPPDEEIAINKFANNSKYLPISFVQTKLDELFLGLYETENFTFQVIANEIVGKVTLKYFHPIAKVWLKREGTAAVQIQMTSVKNGGSGDITNIRDKIINTLSKDQPHLLASCICSAARSIGKIFGRDLNRKLEDTYETHYSDIAKAETAIDLIDWSSAKTKNDLGNIYRAHPALHNNPTFIKKFGFEMSKLNK